MKIDPPGDFCAKPSNKKRLIGLARRGEKKAEEFGDLEVKERKPRNLTVWRTKRLTAPALMLNFIYVKII